MEFFFTKDDGLYQILKLLEKLPPQKPVEIFIDPEHGFFENIRRGKQAKEIIENRKLNITFRTKKEKNRKYYLQIGLKVNHQEEKKVMKAINVIRLFFVDIKKFHLQTFDSQKYLFFLVFFFEIIIGLLIVWFIIILIIPKATITIYPSLQSENIIYNFRFYPKEEISYPLAINQISIPYSSGNIKYNYELSMGTLNLKYIQNPSRGTVSIYNKTPREITLVPKTRFVTSNKLVFLSKDIIKLPSGTAASPSETKVVLYAATEDEYGEIMGARGNIEKNTTLLIRNLKESYYLSDIRAETLEDFRGGSANASGSVTEKDIQLLIDRFKENIYTEKISIVSERFRVPNAMIISFDRLIKTHFEEIKIDAIAGDVSPTINGLGNITFEILYILWDDIFEAYKQYIYERQSDNRELISIDKNSFAFIEQPSYLIGSGIFLIPAKITILQGYDFQKDPKNILGEIKNQIVGKNVAVARKDILDYSEVGSVEIKTSSFAGNTIPTIKSRISIKVNK